MLLEGLLRQIQDTSSKSQQWQGDPATVGANPYIDDQTFTQELLVHLTTNYCIDTSRMMATGMSNGGGFTGILACNSTLSKQFSAFAVHSGAVYTANQGPCSGNVPSTVLTNTVVQSVCSPGRNNVPILEFHGDADGTTADDRLAEQFQRQYMDDMARRRQRKKPAQPSAPPGPGEDVLKGPKLGGSRNARAAVRDALLKKEKEGRK